MNEKRPSSIALFRSLPPVFRASWLLIALGVLGMAVGYALPFTGAGWVGGMLFLAGYPPGLWPLLRSSPAGESGGLFVAGLVMSTVTALFFLAIQLAIAALLAGVLLFLGRFHSESALRILHFIGLMTAAAVLISIPRAIFIVKSR